MKRSGNILIWLACGMVFCAIARADDAVNPDSSESTADILNQLRHTTSPRDRMRLIKELHAKHPMPAFQTAQPASATSAANPEGLRQRTTELDRTALDQPRGMQPLPASAAGSNAQANTGALNNIANTDTPYGSIAVRNVFGLNPIPPPAPPQDPNATPPPKITLTGITTIFGPAEALYKVGAYAKNGKQIAEQSYILTEGEEQDDVEVTAIDTQKDIVTFNNHGQTQAVPLANGVATGGDSGSVPSRPRFGGPMGGGNIPGNLPENIRQRLQQRFGNMNGMNGPGQNGLGQSSTPPFSADDTAALVAAQHVQAEQAGSPTAPLFPPTKYDNEAHQPPGP